MGIPADSGSIELFLIERVAAALQLDPSAIDPGESFANLGLGSTEAISMSGELAERLGREVSPTLVWEFPTITELARYLESGS